MSDLLRDSIWTFVGSFLALIAIIIAIVTHHVQKRKKRILIETITAVPLIRAVGEIDELEVKFQGKKIDNALLVIFKISNVGNTPIPADDYEAPIQLKFDDSINILNANFVSSSPENIPADITSNGNRATIAPRLLNSGDNVSYKVLLAGSDASFEVFGRISGVKLLERNKSIGKIRPLFIIFGAVVMMISFTISPSPKSISLLDIRPEEIPYAIGATVGAFVFSFAAIGELIVAITRLRMLYEKD